MAARFQLKHRIRVERESDNLAVNDFGEPLTDTLVVHESLPAIVWDGEGEIVDSDGTLTTIIKHHAIVPYGSDVKEHDLVTEITDRRGTSLFGDVNYRINSIAHQPKEGTILTMESAE